MRLDAFLNVFLFRVDQVPDVQEMFGVERPRTADGDRQLFTRAEFEAVRRDTSVFTDVFAQVTDVDGRLEGRAISGTFVTGNFFQVLGVSAVAGRALTPADDGPAVEQPVIVLSHGTVAVGPTRRGLPGRRRDTRRARRAPGSDSDASTGVGLPARQAGDRGEQPGSPGQPLAAI